MPGLTPGEQRIMDLWDAGLPMAAIARRLDAPRARIAKAITAYHDDGEQARDNSHMVRASARLAAAINRAGGHP